jgi:hypothetical protein
MVFRDSILGGIREAPYRLADKPSRSRSTQYYQESYCDEIFRKWIVNVPGIPTVLANLSRPYIFSEAGEMSLSCQVM